MLAILEINGDAASLNEELAKLVQYQPEQLLGVGANMARYAIRCGFGYVGLRNAESREQTAAGMAESCALFATPATLIAVRGHGLDEAMAVYLFNLRWRLAGNDATPGLNTNPLEDPWCVARIDELHRTVLRGPSWRADEPDERGRPDYAALERLYLTVNDGSLSLQVKAGMIQAYVELSSPRARKVRHYAAR